MTSFSRRSCEGLGVGIFEQELQCKEGGGVFNASPPPKQFPNLAAEAQIHVLDQGYGTVGQEMTPTSPCMLAPIQIGSRLSCFLGKKVVGNSSRQQERKGFCAGGDGLG